MVGGRYEQLNANILQIENEYYSTVRPKPLLQGMEKPVTALRERGVCYIELRSLDVNAYHPLGVSDQQLHFLEAFMLFCLLLPSPPISLQEQREIDQNLGGWLIVGAILRFICFARDGSCNCDSGRVSCAERWSACVRCSMQTTPLNPFHRHFDTRRVVSRTPL